MGQALYRKYRPRSLKDVVGEEHITKTLTQALKSGQISHAYLFTGPKGVGKTSVARILAHEINHLNYDGQPHMDIIEIDAASNRRIDEIRDLREKVYVSPSQLKYKVYIIDEVHMLTREAFNALLKTLEEPPEHVVFILATTDAHKLPETIISRTQRYSFKPIKPDTVVSLLKQIAQKEKIDVDAEALDLLARHGEGSLRDSTSLLDQARNQSGRVNGAVVAEMLGLPPEQAIDDLLNGCIKGADSASTIGELSNMYAQGYQASIIAKQLGQAIRHKLINQPSGLGSLPALDLLADLIEVPASHDPDRLLEVVLLKATPARAAAKAETVTPAPAAVETQATAQPSRPNKQDQPSPKPAQTVAKVSKPSSAFDPKLWSELLLNLKKTHNTLYGLLRMAQPSFKGDDELDLAFKFDFHKKQISEPNNKKILSDLVKQLTGKDVRIECRVDKLIEVDKPTPVEIASTDDVSTINSIFKGAELLES